jgi:hypothetical protein
MRRFCVERRALANPKRVANYDYAVEKTGWNRTQLPRTQSQKMAEREGFEPSLRFNP